MTGLNGFFMGLLSHLLVFPLIQGLLFGGGIWVFASLAKQEKEFLQGVFGVVTVLGCGVPLAWFLLFFMKHPISTPMYWWGAGVFVGLAGVIYLDRSGVMDKIAKKMTKKSSLAREGRTDIRELMESQKKLKNYDPVKYFKEDGWFIGLDHQEKPVYLDYKKLPHMQINGASGSGKTVQLANITAQAITKGEATFVFDPKGDEWLPHVAKKSADRVGVNYRFVDLKSPIAQINIFEGTTVEERYNLFVVGFELFPNGEAADFYRAIDREGARFLAENYESGESFSQLLQKHEKYLRSIKAEGLIGKLKEMAYISSLNSRESAFCLREAMANGDFVNIVGDTDNEAVKQAQMMLFVRVYQLAIERGNFVEPKQVCVVVDELSFFMSKILINALATKRDKGIHYVLAYQSIGDLLEVPKYMDGKATQGKVLTNAKLHFSYRAQDVATAEFYSELSGSILVDDEVRHIDKSLAMTENISENRQIRQAERAYMDKNQLLSLPDGCGVMYGVGLAKKAHVSPFLVEKTLEAVTVEGAQGEGAQGEGEEVAAKRLSFDDL
jgi:hypothetical protein